MLKILITTKGNTMKMNALDKVAMLLLIVGGFNWGLVGWLKYNLVDEIFGVESAISRVVYAVVGVASVYCIYSMVKMLSSSSSKS
jgi:uncharacterized membrane protein YuzA (DUF378 family)